MSRNKEAEPEITPEEETAIKEEVDALVADAMNVTQDDLRTELFLGFVKAPRFPLIHSLILLTLGALMFVIQLIASVDMHTMKLTIAGEAQLPEGQRDIMLWPTIICLFMSYALWRRHTLRRTVVGVKLRALLKGFQISTGDAEDVVITIRKSWSGILLAVTTFSILMLGQMMIVSMMINLYLKYLT